MQPVKLFAVVMVAMLLCTNAIASPGSDMSHQPAQPSDGALIARLNQAAGGQAQIFRHAATGKVRFISMPSDRPLQRASSLSAGTPEQASRAFMASYGQLFGLRDPANELALMQQTELPGRSFVRFQQVYQGVPIVGGELIVQTDQQRAVRTANGEALPDLRISVQPHIGADAAAATALGVIARAYGLRADELTNTPPQLWIYNPELLGGPGLPESRLVWRTQVSASTPGQPIRELVLIDAQKGVVALHFNQIADAKDRRVCTDNNLVDPDGNPDNDCTPAHYVRVEGQGPTGDADVDLAYNYAGATYNYFFNNFNRDSLDGKGLPLTSLVKYCPGAANCPYENAFWDGQQMIYGDGFASADDVVGHELSHGFTEFTSHLFYYYQSGAINESLSDVFGELIDQTDGLGNDASGVRWQIGEDLPASVGVIRNMQDPTIFNDPDRMTSPNYTADAGEGDSGGVHTNSGVNNKAAYLMTDGGSFNGQTISGLGAAKVGAIYYTLEVAFLTSASDYQDLYTDLPAACNSLASSGAHGITAADCAQVQKVVTATEMNITPPAAPAPQAPICAAGQTVNDLFFDDVENPASGKWITSTASGSNVWYYPGNSNPFGYDQTYATSGSNSIWGDNPGGTGQNPITPVDSSLRMTQSVVLPANAYMHFNHAYGFEDDTARAYDGGVLEYSTDSGATWQDAGPLFDANGYNGTISAQYGNPLGGRQAFVRESNGYRSSRLNLGTLAGKSVRFRFRIGTDSVFGDYGWYIDDVRIYTCGSVPVASLRASNITVAENIGKLAIQLKLSSVTDQVVSVPFTVSGTATEHVDYELSNHFFTIPAGSSSASVDLQIIDDKQAEPDETIILTLGTPVNATIDGSRTATIVIQDSTNLRQVYLPLIGGTQN